MAEPTQPTPPSRPQKKKRSRPILKEEDDVSDKPSKKVASLSAVPTLTAKNKVNVTQHDDVRTTMFKLHTGFKLGFERVFVKSPNGILQCLPDSLDEALDFINAWITYANIRLDANFTLHLPKNKEQVSDADMLLTVYVNLLPKYTTACVLLGVAPCPTHSSVASPKFHHTSTSVHNVPKN